MQVLNTIANNRFWNKHGTTVVWGLAGLCLTLAVLRVGWVSYSQAQMRAANYQPQNISPLAQQAQKPYRLADITAANLFGDPTPTPVVSKAPKTTLNLKLQGILSATDPAMSRAIITSGNKQTKLYSVGENIQGAGASVKEIRAYEVLLNRNGATESLPLAKSDKSGKAQLITYSQASVDPTIAGRNYKDVAANSAGQQTNSQQLSAANQNNRATNGTPRKVRKPNFSGLDRALRKMGEL